MDLTTNNRLDLKGLSGTNTIACTKIHNLRTKKFYNIVPRGLYHKTYYGRNLRFP
jgi:hypothetical protein